MVNWRGVKYFSWAILIVLFLKNCLPADVTTPDIAQSHVLQMTSQLVDSHSHVLHAIYICVWCAITCSIWIRPLARFCLSGVFQRQVLIACIFQTCCIVSFLIENSTMYISHVWFWFFGYFSKFELFCEINSCQ